MINQLSTDRQKKRSALFQGKIINKEGIVIELKFKLFEFFVLAFNPQYFLEIETLKL